MEATSPKALTIELLSKPPTSTRKTLKLHIWAPAFTGFGGGIGAFSRAVASGSRELGHETYLFGKLDTRGVFDGVPIEGSGASRISQTTRFAALCLSSIIRARPDVIVSTHLNFGPVAHLARRIVGTRYVLVAHGIDVHSHLPASSVRALRGADQIIAVSEWTRLRVLGLGGIAPRSVRLLANTFDEERFKLGPRSSILAARYGIAPEEKVILTVARLDSGERYKGYDRLVKALPAILAACGKVRLLVVGGGDDGQRLIAMARELGVSDSVTTAGFVPDSELADHYRLADVFAMPSTGEGFGIVFIEAMACGTPVVAGNLDGSVDALDGGALGQLVDPLDAGAIARGVISLLRKEGPGQWFDRAWLHDRVVEKFGGRIFRSSLDRLLSPLARGES